MSRTPRAVKVPGELPAVVTAQTQQEVAAAVAGEGSTSEIELLRAQLARLQAEKEAAEAAARQAREAAAVSRSPAAVAQVVVTRGEAQLTTAGWVVPATYGAQRKV